MAHRLTTNALRRLLFVALLSACALMLAGCPARLDTESPEVEGGDAKQGQEAIVAYGCGSCHTIPGIRTANSTVGPPLTDFGDRAYIAGNLTNNPDNLVRWIQDPQGVEPGTAMPNLAVTDSDARDIAAYLYTLRR